MQQQKFFDKRKVWGEYRGLVYLEHIIYSRFYRVVPAHDFTVVVKRREPRSQNVLEKFSAFIIVLRIWRV